MNSLLPSWYQFYPMNLFLKINSIFFSGKSHSAEKGTFSLETTFLKPKTDRKAGTYPLIK